MKNLNTSILVGKKVYVSGWQYDNSGVLLNGVITETLNAEDNYGRLAYILKTSDAEYKLNWIVVKGLIENGVYEADRMLNSGTSAVIL